MVPGLFYETWLEGTSVNEQGGGIVMRPEHATPVRMARARRRALEPAAAAERVARLHALVGNGGRDQAVAAIRRVIAERMADERVPATLRDQRRLIG